MEAYGGAKTWDVSLMRVSGSQTHKELLKCLEE
jgi:hypothetical protein